MTENNIEKQTYADFIDFNAERMDKLNINGWEIRQNAKLFCFGIEKTDFFGQMSIPFLYLARGDLQKITAVEYFDYFCSLMRKTARFNGCEDRINIVNSDIKYIDREFQSGSFDVLTINPPYEKNGHGIDCPNPVKNAARRETLCNINDIARACAYLLKTGGTMYMIHRPSRICDVLCALRTNGLEPRVLRFVQSKAADAPNLVLISAVKGAPPYLKVDKNLVIYNEDGSYTQDSNKIYDYKKL